MIEYMCSGLRKCIIIDFGFFKQLSIGYTPRARLLNHWATKPEVCNQLVLD